MTIRHALLLIFIAFIWGFNFVVIRWGLDEFPPLLFSALRFTVCTIPILFGVERPPISWASLITLGVTLGLLVFGLLYLAIYAGLNAGMASAVMQAQVFFTLAIGSLVLGDRPDRLSVLAIGVGLAGLTLIFLHNGEHAPALGFALALLAAVSWAISNIMIKKLPKVQMLNLMVWISLVPPLPLFLLSYAFEGREAIIGFAVSIRWSGAFAILYTSAFSTLLAYGVWGAMLQRYSATAVAPFALLVPVFGLTAAALLLGTRLTGVDLAGPALIILALILNGIGNAAAARRAVSQNSLLPAESMAQRSRRGLHDQPGHPSEGTS